APSGYAMSSTRTRTRSSAYTGRLPNCWIASCSTSTMAPAQDVRHQRRPPGLVRRTQALAGVTVEELAECQVLRPQRGRAGLDTVAVRRPPPIRPRPEQVDQPGVE